MDQLPRMGRPGSRTDFLIQFNLSKSGEL